MSDTTTTPRFAVRDFTDAGTGQFFEKGSDVTQDAKPGAIANYEAAGLVGDEPATPAADAAETKVDTAAETGSDAEPAAPGRRSRAAN